MRLAAFVAVLAACAPAGPAADVAWFPKQAQPWAGVVAIAPDFTAKALRVDGRRIARSALAPAFLVDTRGLADGAHVAEIELADGRRASETFTTRNPKPARPLSARFREIEQAWLSTGPVAGWGGDTTRAAVAGDVDGDGDLDVFAWEPRTAVLLRNEGGWSFSREFLPLPEGDSVRAAAFADFDGDGREELVVGADVLSAWSWVDEPVRLDVDWGVPPAATARGTGFHVGDLDGDGLVDLSMGHLGCGTGDGRAFLFRNEGGLHFRELAGSLGLGLAGHAPFLLLFERRAPGAAVDVWPFTEGCAPLAWWTQPFTFDAAPAPAGPRLVPPAELAAMGSVRLDVDGDGTLDLWVAGTAANEALPGDDPTRDVAAQHGLSALGDAAGNLSEQWGMALVDADLDGLPDVAVLQGNNRPDLGDALRPRTQLLWQHAAGEFTEAAAASGLAFEGNCRTLAAADLDGDGDADLLAGCLDRLHVLRNDGEPGRGSTIVLRGSVSNPDGIDAQLRARATGERRHVRGGGQPAIAGAGRESAWLAGGGLAVSWPSGLVQEIPAPAAGVVEVREPRVLGLSARRVAPGGGAVDVFLDPRAAGASAGTLGLTGGRWAVGPAAGADGVWRGSIAIPDAAGEIAVDATLDGVPFRVRPRVYVRP